MKEIIPIFLRILFGETAELQRLKAEDLLKRGIPDDQDGLLR